MGFPGTFPKNLSAKINPGLLFITFIALAILGVALVMVFEEQEPQDVKELGQDSIALHKGTEPQANGTTQETKDMAQSEPYDREVLQGTGTPEQRFRLDEPISLMGLVLEEEGTPIAGAKVRASLIFNSRGILPPEDYESFLTESDAEGRFLFEGVPGGAYSFSAVKGELAGRSSPFGDRSAKYNLVRYFHKWPVDIEIVMRASGTISGRVVNLEGQPIPGALVIPYNMNASQVKTDPSGRFSLRHLEIGSYYIQVRADGWVQNQLPRIYTDTNNLKIRLSRGASISGTVLLDQEPVPNIEVFALKRSGKGMPGYTLLPVTTLSGPNGSFVLQPLAEGKYVLGIQNPHYSAPGEKEIEVLEGENLKGIDMVLKRNGSLSGQVTAAATGKPLAGFEVCAQSWPQSGNYMSAKPNHTITDEKGCFEIPNLKPGIASAAVLGNNGYASAIKERVEIPEEGKKEGVDFRLEKGAALHLILSKESGERISGAEIGARRFHEDVVQLFDPLPEIQETEEGVYVMDGLGAGKYELSVHRRGWIGKREKVTIDPESGSTTMELVLSPTLMKEGRVLDPGKSPVAGALVSIGNHGRALTGEDGTFKVYYISPGKNRIHIHAKGFLDFLKSMEIDKETEALEFTLHSEESHFLSGRVKNDLGNPLSNVKIEITQGEREKALVKSVITDSEGAFRFEDLLDGTARLIIESKHGRVMGDFTEILVDRSDVEIVIERFACIKGQVKDASHQLVEQFNISAYTQGVEGQRGNSSYLSCTNGVFDLRRVYPGQVVVSAYAWGVGDGQTDPLTLGLGETMEGIEIILKPFATLSGVVRDKTTREPLAGVSIYAGEDLRRSRWQLQGGYPKSTSAEDGSFTLENLQPGILDVAADHPDYCVGMREGISVLRGEITEGIEILLSKGCEIEGRVCVNGQGREGVRIEVSGPDGEFIRIQSEKNGYFHLKGLTPGMYSITAHLREEGCSRFTRIKVYAKEGEVQSCDLTFQGNASIMGRVVLSGKPMDKVYISAILKEARDPDDPLQATVSGVALSKEDGSYRIDGLSPGLFKLFIKYRSDKGEVSTGREINLMEGVTVCDIELDETGLGEVSGFLHENGIPVKDARVFFKVHSDFRREETDDTGHFMISDVPAGEVTANISYYSEQSGGYIHSSKKIRIMANQSIQEDFNITLGKGRISGSITCNNQPVDHARIYIKPDTVKESFSITCFSQEGSFHVGSLPSGKYRVSLSSPWFMQHMVEVDEAIEVRVVFDYNHGNAGLTAYVEKPVDEEEYGTTSVCLFTLGTCPWKTKAPLTRLSLSQGLLATWSVHGEGTIRQEGLAPGTYDVVALRDKDGQVVKIDQKRVVLQEGETTEVYLDVMGE